MAIAQESEGVGSITVAERDCTILIILFHTRKSYLWLDESHDGNARRLVEGIKRLQCRDSEDKTNNKVQTPRN
jgi:hypothetical protein